MYAYASSGLTARSIGASWNTPSGDGACFKFNDRDCILVQWVAYRRAPSQLTVTVSGANSAAILSTTL